MKQLMLDCAINLRSKSRLGTLDAEDMGICYQLNEIAGEVFDSEVCATELTPYFITWPMFSGSTRYPVPYVGKVLDCLGNEVKFKESEGLSVRAERAYIFGGYLWLGEYGDLRKNLLDHIINELEKELK
jgi:hypothetical protein